MILPEFSKSPHQSFRQELSRNLGTSRIVYYPDIARIPFHFYLADEEREELAHKDERKRAGWLASRYAAKQIALSLWPEVQAKDITIGHAANGVPILLEGRKNIAISLSHSGSYGAAAFPPLPGLQVGVDIERIRKFPLYVLRSFLTETEDERLRREPTENQPHLATLFWSFKEAYLKAKGVGLRQHPQTIEIYGIEGENPAVFDMGKRVQGKLYWYTPDREHIMTLIYTNPHVTN